MKLTHTGALLAVVAGGAWVTPALAAGPLETSAPAQLHPLPTASPSMFRDNVTDLLTPRPAETSGKPEDVGTFGMPFADPLLNGQNTDAKCVEAGTPNGGKACKPAAGTLINLPDGRILYWDALEGTENNKFSIVAEGGTTFTNDSSRLLTFPGGKPTWSTPDPFDGGANPKGNAGEPLLPGGQTTETYNDGALFGSHQAWLPDGRLLIQGGTDYSLDPGVDGIPFGAVELTGLKATRIFDPRTSSFSQVADTNIRRWYPTLVQTGDGKMLDFSGVGKLLKPVYPDHPQDSLTNVKQVESYDPAANKWTQLPSSADRDLPLYPRVHLLPNGNVFYNADGQDFNPFGESAGEATWGNLATFSPKTNAWTELGIANPDSTAPSFRGSTSSTMLPLEPNSGGKYSQARFLTAGGVTLPSPGSYLAVAQSGITTVDTHETDDATKSTTAFENTGPLHASRWFGQNVVLPTGDVMVFSGANADEVVGPGTEIPNQQAELFDVASKTWQPMAVAHNPRTYHNTAVLLPSGEILVGGHATISTLYLNNTTLPGGFAPHDGRDPSFEVYKPPYLFRGDRPQIDLAATSQALNYGGTFEIPLAAGTDPASITRVSITRNTAITHIVDADQRQVVLPVVSRGAHSVTVQAPPSGDVAPAGPYMLFVQKDSDKGPVPSVAKQLMVGTPAQTATSTSVIGSAASVAKACGSKRSFTVHLPVKQRKTVRKAVLQLNGKTVKTLRRLTRRTARKGTAISLKGLPRGSATVRIVMTLKSGKKVVDLRRYRTCTKKA